MADEKTGQHTDHTTLQPPWAVDAVPTVSLLPRSRYADPNPISTRQDARPDFGLLDKNLFFQLLGVHAPPASPTPGTLITNLVPQSLDISYSLYGQIRKKHKAATFWYWAFDLLAYGLLTLQLLLSALFIILGSLREIDSHTAVAVLGAISTMTVGALALMKGQGLPNRLREYRNSLAVVMTEANEMFADALVGKEVYYRDIRRLREDFLSVVKESQDNHPDTWSPAVAPMLMVQGPLGRGAGSAPGGLQNGAGLKDLEAGLGGGEGGSGRTL